MSGTGGAREGAGRPKGVPNKVNRDLREAAQEYTEESLETLVAIMRDGKTERARVAAADKILDRGHGKAIQTSNITVNDKRDPTDWTRDDLVALLSNARNGGNGTHPPNGRGGKPDPVH